MESFEIEFNVNSRAIVIFVSSGEEIKISLDEQPSVAQFYTKFMSVIGDLGHKPDFINKPLDLGIDKPFNELSEYHHYDWDAIEKFWKIMVWNRNVFEEFGGRFYGKSCPVHIYWHHLDLTMTRFSGKKLDPLPKDTRILEKETYSHEQISFGFWAGDDNVREPTYYSYTYPSPNKLDRENLNPVAAKWIESNGSPMAILRFEDIRKSEKPRADLLSFLESAYQAGAKKASWDIPGFTVPSLDEL